MSTSSKANQEDLLQRIHDMEKIITRSQDAEALRDNEARLRAIVDHAVEGIVTIDSRGIIESANPATEKIFGYQVSELVGRNISMLMPSPYREGHDGYLENYLKTGRAKIIGIGREVVGKRKNGEIFPMDLSVSEVQIGKQRMFTGIIRDITIRKELEKQVLEISDQVQQRIGQDLHDGLCQQLTGIEFMCQVLEQKLASKAPQETVHLAEISRHVRTAIAQTRDLARGMTPVILENEGLRIALEELALTTERVFGISCIVQSEGDPQVPIASAVHLYRITQEAIQNAIRHGKATSVMIQLNQGSGQLHLRIQDNGMGFVESSNSTKGHGLKIMNYRAEMIQGRVIAGKSPLGGVEIHCRIPLT